MTNNPDERKIEVKNKFKSILKKQLAFELDKHQKSIKRDFEAILAGDYSGKSGSKFKKTKKSIEVNNIEKAETQNSKEKSSESLDMPEIEFNL